jgi:uncharacterized membrane protein
MIRYLLIGLVVFNALALAALAAALLYVWASPAASTLSRAL